MRPLDLLSVAKWEDQIVHVGQIRVLRLTMSHVDQKVIHFDLVDWLAVLEELSLGSVSLDRKVPSFLTFMNESFSHELLAFVWNHVNFGVNIFGIFAVRPQNHRNLLRNIDSDRMMNFKLFLKMSRLDELLARHENVTHEICVNPANSLHPQSCSDLLEVLFVRIS